MPIVIVEGILMSLPTTFRHRTDASPRGRRYLALIVICMAEFLVVLDNTLVNVALPSMGVELQADMSGLQWMVDAFTLAFAGLLLALGHLGDRYGRRRIMVFGLAGIAVMSTGGAVAAGLGQVIAARAGMGVFAAAVFPATLALIINIFTEPRPGRGHRAWTAMAGFASRSDRCGGCLLEYFCWHRCSGSMFRSRYVPLRQWGGTGISGRAFRTSICLASCCLWWRHVLVWTIIEAPTWLVVRPQRVPVTRFR